MLRSAYLHMEQQLKQAALESKVTMRSLSMLMEQHGIEKAQFQMDAVHTHPDAAMSATVEDGVVTFELVKSPGPAEEVAGISGGESQPG